MPATRTTCMFLLILFVFLQTIHFSFSQTTSYPYHEWLRKLSDKNAPTTSGLEEVLAVLKDKDSTDVYSIFNELEKRGESAGRYFPLVLISLKLTGPGEIKYSVQPYKMLRHL